MTLSEVDIHRYHISLISGSIPYRPPPGPHGLLANVHPALLASASSSAFAPLEPAMADTKKRKRKATSPPPPALRDTTSSIGIAAPPAVISEADLMAFHHSHAHLFSNLAASTSSAGSTYKLARRHPRAPSHSPSKTLIPLSSPSSSSAPVSHPLPHIPYAHIAPLVPYSSSNVPLQCSSSFDGALMNDNSDDWQDAMDEDEVDQLATVPRPAMKRKKPKTDEMDTPTAAAGRRVSGAASGKLKSGVARLQELRGAEADATGAGAGGGFASPLNMLKRVLTPPKPPNGDLPTSKKKEKKSKPFWQVNTPQAGYGLKK